MAPIDPNKPSAATIPTVPTTLRMRQPQLLAQAPTGQQGAPAVPTQPTPPPAGAPSNPPTPTPSRATGAQPNQPTATTQPGQAAGTGTQAKKAEPFRFSWDIGGMVDMLGMRLDGTRAFPNTHNFSGYFASRIAPYLRLSWTHPTRPFQGGFEGHAGWLGMFGLGDDLTKMNGFDAGLRAFMGVPLAGGRVTPRIAAGFSCGYSTGRSNAGNTGSWGPTSGALCTAGGDISLAVRTHGNYNVSGGVVAERTITGPTRVIEDGNRNVRESLDATLLGARFRLESATAETKCFTKPKDVKDAYDAVVLERKAFAREYDELGIWVDQQANAKNISKEQFIRNVREALNRNGGNYGANYNRFDRSTFHQVTENELPNPLPKNCEELGNILVKLEAERNQWQIPRQQIKERKDLAINETERTVPGPVRTVPGPVRVVNVPVPTPPEFSAFLHRKTGPYVFPVNQPDFKKPGQPLMKQLHAYHRRLANQGSARSVDIYPPLRRFFTLSSSIDGLRNDANFIAGRAIPPAVTAAGADAVTAFKAALSNKKVIVAGSASYEPPKEREANIELSFNRAVAAALGIYWEGKGEIKADRIYLVKLGIDTPLDPSQERGAIQINRYSTIKLADSSEVPPNAITLKEYLQRKGLPEL
jgi:hypothetical protein